MKFTIKLLGVLLFMAQSIGQAQPQYSNPKFQDIKKSGKSHLFGLAPLANPSAEQLQQELEKTVSSGSFFQEETTSKGDPSDGVQSGLCVDDLYLIGCDAIDGLTYWDLANINDVDIECAGDPSWYHDLTDSVHFIPQLYDNILTVKAGFWYTYFDVWVDLNDDLILTSDEIVINDGYCEEPDVAYEFYLTLPESATAGDHVMRVRSNFNDPVTSPCSTLYYGTCVDFSITVVDPISNDVGVVSIDMVGFYEPGPVTPLATVKNLGVDTQSFDVTITSTDGYSSTVAITDFEPGEEVQVEFDSWEADYGTWQLNVCTELEDDEVAYNNCKSKSVIIADAKPAFGYMAVDLSGTSGVPVGPILFDLNDPGEFYSLLSNPVSQFLSSACWIPGGLVYASMYLGGLYEMDPETGTLTYLMSTPSLTGLTYDGQTLFGLAADGSANTLHEIDVSNGTMTAIGNVPTTGNLLISIDCNAAGDMYGYDIVDNTFYAIDKTNGSSTAIGYMGYDFAFAQDMSFDRDEDVCYLAGYTPSTGGGLYSVDVATGTATFISALAGNAEVTALAIPYESSLPANDLAVNVIVDPLSGPYLSEEEIVTIKILNAGQNTQTGFEVSYSVNGGDPVTEIFTGEIGANENALYSFTTPADLSQPGMFYEITACTLHPDDENTNNDCVGKEVFHSYSFLPSPAGLTGEQIGSDVHLSWSSPITSGTIFFDDFEEYDIGSQVALNNSAWTTWTDNPGSAEDATISDDYSYSPSQSMKMSVSNDMVYPTGNTDIGIHELNNKIYFPESSSGWVILMQSFEPGNYIWGSQTYFSDNGTGYIDGGGAAAASFTFDYDTWLNIRNYINLEDDIAEFWIDEELIHTWQWSSGVVGTGDLKLFGGMDFFQPADLKFYVDDFSHQQEFTENLTGYEIFRNGEYLGSTSDTSYIDVIPLPDTYNYCVYAIYSDGESEPACVSVDVTTAIPESDAGSLSIYPVPAMDFVVVSAPGRILSYEVYNMDGQVLLTGYDVLSANIHLDMAEADPGVYVIRVEVEGNKFYNEKIIIR